MTGDMTGHMRNKSQRRAVEQHRLRLRQRGISRYEVRGLDSDKELVRQFAKRLSEGDNDASKLRVEIAEKVSHEPSRRGGVFAALRRSPLVGADLELRRDV